MADPAGNAGTGDNAAAAGNQAASGGTAATAAAAEAAAAAAAAKAGGEAAADGGKKDGDPAADGAKKPEDAKKAEVPEKYEFKMPEGVKPDTEAIAAFEPVAKELGLSNEQAQKIVDLYVAQQTKSAEAQQKGWQETQDGWRKAHETDKDLGGTNLAETRRLTGVFLNTFGNEALFAALDATGMGDHPELIRAFSKAGKALSEANIVTGGKDPVAAKTLAQRLYPSLPS